MSEGRNGTIQFQRPDGPWETLGDLRTTLGVDLAVGDSQTVHVRFARSQTVFHWTWPPDAETLRGIRKRAWAARYRRRYERLKARSAR
jgi:hypothetical protein